MFKRSTCNVPMLLSVSYISVLTLWYSYHQNFRTDLHKEPRPFYIVRNLAVHQLKPNLVFGNSKNDSSKMPYGQCSPIQRIVFIKTHKTASTTTASIFERYGYYRNLTFALGRTHVFSNKVKFNHKMVLKFPGLQNQVFDILCNHALYNKQEMDLVVPKATYITILRKPEDQLESAFSYFKMYKGMKVNNKANVFKTFMDNPMNYYQERNYGHWFQSRNGQLFDLGFEHHYDENDTKIMEFIMQIDEDFDLILLTEHYDESLILLKKLLCWEFEDILYMPKAVRKASLRYDKDDDLVKKIRNWNHGDVLLYDHFNKTFWRKVAEYGTSFETDLKKFRELNREAFGTCIDLIKFYKNDGRVNKYMLKNTSERCYGFITSDVLFTTLIRSSMTKRFGKVKSVMV